MAVPQRENFLLDYSNFAIAPCSLQRQVGAWHGSFLIKLNAYLLGLKRKINCSDCRIETHLTF